MNSQGLGGLDAGSMNSLRTAFGNVSQQVFLHEIDILNDYFQKVGISPEQGLQLVAAAVKGGSTFKRGGDTLMAIKPLPPSAAQIYFFSVEKPDVFAKEAAQLLAPLKQAGVQVVYMNKVDPTIVKALQAIGVAVQQSDRPEFKVMGML